jgi:hypothetical protein
MNQFLVVHPVMEYTSGQNYGLHFVLLFTLYTQSTA